MNRTLIACSLVFAGFAAALWHAAPEDEDVPGYDWDIPQQPVEQLPKGVPAPEGRLTLFVDYRGAANERLDCYLINRIADTVALPAQDRDLYLKQEAQGAGGRWFRTQKHHYSWCGNSYHLIRLAPGRFIRVQAPFLSSGPPAIVRYRTYSNVQLAGSGQVFQVRAP